MTTAGWHWLWVAITVELRHKRILICRPTRVLQHSRISIFRIRDETRRNTYKPPQYKTHKFAYSFLHIYGVLTQY